VTEIKL